ncbi:hypothetical protein [Thiogranum longum]|nr:hypothetical protein [Thiogranum longum]
MLTRILIIMSLAGLASACDNAASQLEAEASVCEKALGIGALELAEEHCQRALGEPGNDILTPQVRSERLYRLAGIKRQQAKYAEAAELLDQSLSLEQTLSGSGSLQFAGRQLERVLILAGQGRWPEGARLLEQTLPMSAQLSEKEQASLANILQRYIAQLQKIGQTEQASRLQVAADSLKQQE